MQAKVKRERAAPSSSAQRLTFSRRRKYITAAVPPKSNALFLQNATRQKVNESKVCIFALGLYIAKHL